MNRVSYFEIQAANLDRAKDFYAKVFGWHFIKDDTIPIPYWRIEMAGLYGGLLQRQVTEPASRYGTNAFVCSIQVDNFDKMTKSIIENGGRIALKKIAVVGKCWQGYFLDTEGNVFGLFQVDDKAK